MDLLPLTRRARIADAIKLVAAEYDLTADDLRGRGRTHDVALARHIAMWVARRVTSQSYPVIALAFGKRDHTAAVYAIARIEAMLVRDPSFGVVLDRLSQQVWEQAPVRQETIVEEIIASTSQLRVSRVSATISADLASWIGLGGTFERGTFEVRA